MWYMYNMICSLSFKATELSTVVQLSISKVSIKSLGDKFAT